MFWSMDSVDMAWCGTAGRAWQSYYRLECTKLHLLEAKGQSVSGSVKSNLLSFLTLGLLDCNLLL